ncbi:hypothetical protein Tco_0100537, partial [Tanacetum coccineum]
KVKERQFSLFWCRLKVIRAAFAHAMNESESSPSSFPGYAVSSTFASSSAFDSSLTSFRPPVSLLFRRK